MGRRAKDISGMRFGELRAVEPTNRRCRRSVVWRCKCLRCGRECFVSRKDLVSGNTKSCGCLCRDSAASRMSQRETLVGGTDLDLLTQKKGSNNTSGVKGVGYDKVNGKWRAYIRLAGKLHHLGRFDTLEEAAQARRQAEAELFDPILQAHGRKPAKEGK